MAWQKQMDNLRRGNTGGRSSRSGARTGSSGTTSLKGEARATSLLSSRSLMPQFSIGFASTESRADQSATHAGLSIGAHLVRITQCGIDEVNSIRDGSGVSRQSAKCSTPATNGRKYAPLSGSVTRRFASGAGYVEQDGLTCRSISITLFRSQIKSCGLNLPTSSFCVRRATNSSILERT